MALKSARYPLILAVVFVVCGTRAFAAAAPTKQATVAELVAIVRGASDSEAKKIAIDKLAEITEADERNYNIVDLLIDVARGTRDPFVGKSAVRTLTRLQTNVTQKAKTRYIDAFTILLKDSRAVSAIRTEIAQCFIETLDKDSPKDKDAVRILIEIAKSRTEPNVALRAKCIEAIGAFGNADNVGVLCDLLSDPDSYIREAAAKAVSILLDKDPTAGGNISQAAVNKIVDMVKDDKLETPLRVIAIKALGKLISTGAPGANKGLDDLIKLVKSSTDDDIVQACIDALGQVGTAQAADPLIATYNDFFDANNPSKEKDWPRRKAVARAMRQLLSVQANKKTPELAVVHKVTDLLMKIVDNEKEIPQVKESAVYAIGYLYPMQFQAEHKDASLTLILYLEKLTGMSDKQNADSATVKLITDALEAITNVNYGTDVKRWKEWWQTKFNAKIPAAAGP
ncbi:MAG TPA: HEAT repeat domain-containing protein [Planctomycetota bacterium]|nr:HEAT repeat domain-containing protein [Planctomycetota bacterium]